MLNSKYLRFPPLGAGCFEITKWKKIEEVFLK